MSDHLADHERVGPILASYERAWAGEAAQHEEQAEQAKDRKTRAMGQHVNAPPDARGRMEGVYDAQIAKHERQARVHRRRAEHAAAGYVLHGPDESTDADYMRAHQDVIELARKTGRLRQSGEACD